MNLLVSLYLSFMGLFGCVEQRTDKATQQTVQPATILEFSYGTYTMVHLGGVNCRAERISNDSVKISYRPANQRITEEFVTDSSILDLLYQLVTEGKMYEYKSSYRPSFDILDGDGWTLMIRFSDGKRIESSGCNSAPNGAYKLFRQIETYFEKLNETSNCSKKNSANDD